MGGSGRHGTDTSGAAAPPVRRGQPTAVGPTNRGVQISLRPRLPHLETTPAFGCTAGCGLSAGNIRARVIRLGVGSDLLLWYLIQDGYLESRYPDELDVSTSTHQLFRFTPSGIAFLRRWMEARPLDVKDQEPDTVLKCCSEVQQPQQPAVPNSSPVGR
jgi:hypothetical protein